ncbi:MAG: aminotransferase class I/II-fold pyridoxal phosphate-dependent enzyme, partial [Clostridia bacterium]
MNYNTPLYDALKAYSKKNMIPFHMPGHKLGAGFPEQFRDSFLDIDLTELPDTDDLHAPEGPIEEAQKLAAEAFGARQTFFLVNGSTCGIQTMIAGVCNPGDILIVDRNCHLSVIHSLILCGVIPQYIYPEYISDLDFIGGINPHEVEEALKKHPDAKGVFITCPTYHGICSDIKTIADIVHRYDKMLLVDEAHGAHFCFHPSLPQGALHAGADICVQSAHKTLPALTQSALLHVNSFNIDLQRIKRCLK